MRILQRDRVNPGGFDTFAAALDYPMFLVTAAAGAERDGCLVGFATQTSIQPPRVLVCLSRQNVTTRIAERALWLAVHVLRDGDQELARWFGEATAAEGDDKFLDVSWHPGPAGVPIIDGLDVLVGRVINRIPYLGDHVGHLLAADGLSAVDPARATRRQLQAQELRSVQAGQPADPTTERTPEQLSGVARDPSSIVAVVQSLHAGGFAGEFSAAPHGRVRCQTCAQESDAARCAVYHLRRLEGASDPDELLVVAAIACPRCGTRGTLTLTYGPTATEEDADVLARLPSQPRRSPSPEVT